MIIKGKIMILDTLIASAKKRVEASKERVSPAELLRQLDKAELRKGCFAEALKSVEDVSVIAEIKKRHPQRA